MGESPVVETSALCRSFGNREAVRGLYLAIARGEIFGLLGPNGAGKTTTIRMLTTLLAPTSGRAAVCGHDIVFAADHGLDVPSRHRVWQQIRSLRDEGVTVLLATNYLDEADRLCDRLVIVNAGRTVVEGSPEELKRQVGGDILKVSTIHRDAAATAVGDQVWARRVVVGTDCVHVHVEDASLLLPELLN